ncbi:MAG: M15 family metallopeptidase [Pseudanabaenaceae cyanobacterium SKYGB_i_bin29]|nr:M15 family metallopeptidase [Pseudanabaenaceae cyanobacterium SKYG29]MDW8420279.1 M15 family metallopeptidase [Pseudanabaenaceae cyanobacterium SKYGB_i_bin29]
MSKGISAPRQPLARHLKVAKKKWVSLLQNVSNLPRWMYALGGFTLSLPLFLATASAPSRTPKSQPTQIKPVPAPLPAPDTLFGHYAYDEAPASDLVTIAIAADGYELKLRRAAAQNFMRMQRDAKAVGINLVPLSGYRSKEEQEHLFFGIGQERNQIPAERAKVSAPPGYSEHHTGYAIDIGDGDNPSTDLAETFAQTEAYQWLRHNAARYGFELSFPPNNPQGVMYEPWHWRFVGDTDSLKTFYKVRNRR